MAGPRYFGFVIGGTCPPRWPPTGWPRPGTRTRACTSAAPPPPVVEEVAAALAARPARAAAGASVGFVTGGQMANVTGLAAARHAVLRRAGWDVDAAGLTGAPPIRVVVGAERHVTVDRALRLLGLGTERVPVVRGRRAGRDGRRRARCARSRRRRSDDRLRPGRQREHRRLRPARSAIADAAREAGAWLHVDGAFGLWAAAAPPAAPTWSRASSAPTRGRPTRTSG